MTRPHSARRRFVAALALYVAWVGALAAMAITSSYRPRAMVVPAAAEETSPAKAAPPG